MKMKKTAELTDEERASGKWLPFTPSDKVLPNGGRRARKEMQRQLGVSGKKARQLLRAATTHAEILDTEEDDDDRPF